MRNIDITNHPKDILSLTMEKYREWYHHSQPYRQKQELLRRQKKEAALRETKKSQMQLANTEDITYQEEAYQTDPVRVANSAMVAVLSKQAKLDAKKKTEKLEAERKKAVNEKKEQSAKKNNAKALAKRRVHGMYRTAMVFRDSEELNKGLYNAAADGLLRLVYRHIEAQADVNWKNISGNNQTPIHIAAANGHHSVVEMLLSYGASANVYDDNLVRPLHFAFSDGNVDVIQCLIENGADHRAKDKWGRDVFAYYKEKHSDCSEILSQLLIVGAEKGDMTTVFFAISRGANVNYQDEVRSGQTAMCLAGAGGCIDVFEMLLHHRASVNINDFNGNTPLHHTLAGGNFVGPIVQTLLSHGVCADAKNKFGQSALEYAADRQKKDLKQKKLSRPIMIHSVDYNPVERFEVSVPREIEGSDDTIFVDVKKDACSILRSTCADTLHRYNVEGRGVNWRSSFVTFGRELYMGSEQIVVKVWLVIPSATAEDFGCPEDIFPVSYRDL